MGRMVRKQMYIRASQDAALKRLAAQAGVSEAEIVREAIDRQAGALRAAKRTPSRWRRQAAYIRRLLEMGSVPGGRRWQRDDLHDR